MLSDPILVNKAKLNLLGDYFPLRYSEESRVRIQRYVEDYNHNPDIPFLAKDLSPEERNQLQYILLSIEAFYKQKNKKHVKLEHLIPKIMTLDGISFLKKQRLKSFIMSNGGSMIETPDWWEGMPWHYIEDIGEVFNYAYSMFWESPDEEEYKLSNIPVEADPKYVKLFRKTCDKLLASCSEFDEVKDTEIFMRVTSSKTMFAGKSLPQYTKKNSNLFFSE